MRASSMDLRERALLDNDAGMTAADVAAKDRVSGSWVRLLKQRRRETGEVAPRVQRHGRRGMLEPHLPAAPAGRPGRGRQVEQGRVPRIALQETRGRTCTTRRSRGRWCSRPRRRASRRRHCASWKNLALRIWREQQRADAET